MKKNVRFLSLLVGISLLFLVMNWVSGDVLGFKAFLNDRQSILKTSISITTSWVEPKVGDTVIVNRYESYFKGSVIENSRKERLVNQGSVSVPVESERIYTELINVNLVLGFTIVTGLIILKGVYDGNTFKIKKIKS